MTALSIMGAGLMVSGALLIVVSELSAIKNEIRWMRMGEKGES